MPDAAEIDQNEPTGKNNVVPFDPPKKGADRDSAPRLKVKWRSTMTADGELTSTDIRIGNVCADLSGKDNRLFAKQATIATKAQKSPRTVRASLKTLEEKGYLDRMGKPRFQAPCVYLLTLPEPCQCGKNLPHCRPSQCGKNSPDNVADSRRTKRQDLAALNRRERREGDVEKAPKGESNDLTVEPWTPGLDDTPIGDSEPSSSRPESTFDGERPSSDEGSPTPEAAPRARARGRRRRQPDPDQLDLLAHVTPMADGNPAPEPQPEPEPQSRADRLRLLDAPLDRIIALLDVPEEIAVQRWYEIDFELRGEIMRAVRRGELTDDDLASALPG